MPLYHNQYEWLQGVIAGLTALSDNRWMMPSDHLAVILDELATVIRRCVPGAVVEMGCAGGRTNLRLAAFLQILKEGPGRPLHAYDSFVGFPPLTKEDWPGDTSRENLRYVDGGLPQLFSEWGDSLPPPIIHAGFFTEDGDHPNPIAFAFIDCDTYESVLTSLRIVWPRLSARGVVVVHDYNNPTWPGVAKACNQYLLTKEGTEYDSARVLLDAMLVVTKSIPPIDCCP